jgi:DNA-directed RNA polymerase specialized sigma24 family protein
VAGTTRMRAAASEERPAVVGFDQVYEAELMAVVRLAFLLVRSQALAEELAHDAFLRLYERFGSVDNPAGFLRTVVVRLSITAQNRARMERDRLTVVGGGAPSGGGEPEIDETWAALGRLSPERRTVLVLRFYADMPFGDIAAMVGCTAATARGRARRALADLRRELMR